MGMLHVIVGWDGVFAIGLLGNFLWEVFSFLVHLFAYGMVLALGIGLPSMALLFCGRTGSFFDRTKQRYYFRHRLASSICLVLIVGLIVSMVLYFVIPLRFLPRLLT